MTFFPKLILAAAMLVPLAPPAIAQSRDAERPWWERSNCTGFEGVSWIECQKAISQNKRDRRAGRPPSNQAWWDRSRCLGLEGISWSNCQTARSEAEQQGGRPARDPWTTNQCLGLAGLAFVECHRERDRDER